MVCAHCLNEINCAFERLKNHEEITLLPFRLDQCTLSDDVYYYLGRIHIMDGSVPPEILRVQELVNRIMTILGKEPERSTTVGEGRGEEKTYRITGSIVYPDNHFLGRQKELRAIRCYLLSNENKLFLVGMGGIGKSEIAKMYIKQNLSEYDVVVWMVFEESLMHTIASDKILPIKGLSRQDYPEDDERRYYERKLRILKELGDRRVLFVVDNFDVTDSDPDLEDFCSGSYGILFTTRYHQTCGNIPEVEISSMVDESELLELFHTEYTRMLEPKGLQYVREILRLLDGHTLSVRLVASAMQSRRIQPEKMLQLLRQGSEEMKKQNAKAADLLAEDVARDDSCCKKLVQSMWEFGRHNLNQYADKQMLYSHINTALTKISEQSSLWKTLMLLRAKILWDLSENMEAARIYRVLMERATDTEEALMYHGKIAHCYNGMGDTANCLKIATEAYATIKDIPDEQLTHGQGVEKVFLLHRLAESLRDLGRYEESIDYGRMAMAIAIADKFVRVSVQQSVGWTGYHLAKSLFYAGQAEEAEAILSRSLQMFLEDNDTWSSSYAMDLLGQVLAHRGQYEEALAYSDKANAILVPAYGEEHIDVGHNLYWRANIYRKMGKKEKADQYYRRAVEIYRNKNCHQKAERIEKIWTEE